MSNRHDMAIALWKKDDDNVSLIRYWELERFSRIKHHHTPFYNVENAKNTIAKLLAEENLEIKDIVEIWGCPKLGDSPKSEVGDFYFHSLSHLFSSLLIDTEIFYNERILSLALDLKADNETERRNPDGYGEYVGCFSNCGKVTYFNISSPAILWCICKNELGLQEGSLMALATATKCRLKKTVEVDIGSEFKYPNYILGYEIFNKIFGSITADDVIGIDKNFSINDNLISAGMKEINRITVELMEKQLEDLFEQYSIDPNGTYLSISGGFGLNCPTNSHLLRKYKFKGFLGAPCMDDSGEALGIGLYKFYMGMGRFNFELKHAFYGKSFENSDSDLASLKEQGYIKEISELSPKVFVQDIKNDIIVWYDSCAEIGPRALGHRSLLGDPRKLETKDRLNQVKQRQFWRPVAPIILRECVDDWFEDDIDSPFMLHISLVKEAKKEQVPAILHYDGTARLQTIDAQPMCNTLYNLIKEFYKDTGVPIVCNTSLNDKGEPIINAPRDAIRFALDKKIKVVYINKKRIELDVENLNPFKDGSTVEIDVIIPKDLHEKLIDEENPYHLTANELLWRNTFEFDIKTENGAKMLRNSVKYLYKKRSDMKRLFDFL